MLAVCLLLAGSLSPAWAAARYERVVSLTFPVQPGVSYTDDYHAIRGDHFHRATDLFAATGSPVYAAKSGEIVWIPARGHPTAGNAIQVRGDDGLLYAYYHLQSYADGLRDGSRVVRGQVIAYVGDSGNAAGVPHLHFEIHDERVTDPYGTHRLNPYPSLRAAERHGDYTAAMGARARAADLLRRGHEGDNAKRRAATAFNLHRQRNGRRTGGWQLVEVGEVLERGHAAFEQDLMALEAF